MIERIANTAFMVLVNYITIGAILAAILSAATGQFDLGTILFVTFSWPRLIFLWLMLALSLA